MTSGVDRPKRYRVEWYEIARDDDGQPISRYSNRPDSPAKMVRRHETFDTYDEAKDRRDEINPKIARGHSPAAQRDAGNRLLSHYADAWLDGLAGQVKPRVLADYRANDGTTNSTPGTVNLTVTPVNDTPNAVNDSASTDEDTPRWRATC